MSCFLVWRRAGVGNNGDRLDDDGALVDERARELNNRVTSLISRTDSCRMDSVMSADVYTSVVDDD